MKTGFFKLTFQFILFFFLLFLNISAQDILPKTREWSGTSEMLIAGKNHPWITHTEVSDFKTTPSYEETIQWLRKLSSASPLLSMESIGISPEGREIYLITASKDKNPDPSELKKSGKPLLFVEAGIHAGEIDGKDAGMMLLRDIAFGGKDYLLNRVNLIFIPVLNVDGHERTSPFNRINQRGPENMGWRTNSQNMNLNRDFAKLDTREVRSVVRIMNEYDPDLFVDIHVTDGIDYQYDITMGSVGVHGYSPASAKYLSEQFYPFVYSKLRKMGHIPGPIMFAFNDVDYRDGLIEYSSGPSFSDNYGDVRHIPSVLVENHSLKPYRQRVLGTYVLIEACLELLDKNSEMLRQAKETDQSSREKTVIKGFQIPQFKSLGMWGNIGDSKPDSDIPPDTLEILGISSRRNISQITGKEYVEWTGSPVTIRTPVYRMNEPSGYLSLPKAYWIPAAWNEVIERLQIHGIKIEITKEVIIKEVEMYRITEFEFGKSPYENRMRVTGKPVAEMRKESFPAGSVRIPTDQDLAELIALLLEPSSSDSYLQWGFFLPIFSRTEYAETYALEPLARKMLQESEQLRQEFEKKKAEDPSFASDPDQILRWFYRQSPHFDEKYLLYPVGRELQGGAN